MLHPLAQLLGLLMLLGTCLVHAADIIPVPQTSMTIQLQALDLMEDHEGHASIDEVTGHLRQQFAPISVSDTNFSNSASAYWLRFSLSNATPEPRRLLLEVPATNIDEIALFASGRAQPLFRAPPSTYELVIPSDSTATYHIRVRTSNAVHITPTLYTEDAYIRHLVAREWFIGGTFACGFLVCLAAFAHWLVLRERVNLYFFGYFLTYFIYEVATWGYLSRWLPENSLAGHWVFLNFAYVVNAANLLAGWGLVQGGPRDSLWRRLLSSLAIVNGIGALSGIMLPLEWGYALLYPAIVLSLSTLAIASLDHYLSTQRTALLIYGMLKLVVVVFLIAATLIERINLMESGSSKELVQAAVNIENLFLLMLLLWHSRRQLERRLQREHEILIADAESRSQSAMMSRISHELRTPISGVMGIAELLLDTPLTAHQRDFVETIQHSGRNALDIVNNVVDFSRIESGTMALQHVPFDLGSVVMDAVDSFRSRAEEKQLELICNIDREVPELVKGDPTRLRQILLHLIDNAIKFTEQGEVVISVNRSGEGDSARILLEVADTGPGIAAEEQRKLLNTSRHHPNTEGIGIAITRRLVAMMGGEFGLKSDIGKGSRFWFSLQLPEQLTSPESERRLDASLHGLRLLVVDDNDTNRKIIQQHAVHWGMQIAGAHSGSEALALCRSRTHVGEPFDVIIVDQNMPGMTGLQLAEKLRGEEQESPPIVIMLTGATQMPSSSATRACGVRRVLTKPVSARTLKLIIADELAHQRLPQQPLPPTRQQPAPPAEVDFSHLQILIAEDNPISAKVIEGMLRKIGVKTRTVTNGQQAVEATQRQQFDLIFMDCEMPIMDGLEATRLIRQWEQESHRKPTPVIALTAHTLDEHRESSLVAGMNAHLCKPVERSQLQEVLKQWTAPRIN